MDSPTLNSLETRLDQLSRDEQLWLIERLARHLRQQTPSKQAAFETDLAAMAADPEIQGELRRINDEFLPTERDGLEHV